jgi:hypothetical protein
MRGAVATRRSTPFLYANRETTMIVTEHTKQSEGSDYSGKYKWALTRVCGWHGTRRTKMIYNNCIWDDVDGFGGEIGA